MEPVYTPVIATVLTSFKAMGWEVRTSGLEHVPPTGAVVVATNHVSHLDFTFIGAAVRRQNKRRLRFLAKKEIFDHPIAGPMMRSMRHIPVDRAGAASDALDAATRMLEQGELIGMFPESTISTSFVPLPGKSGAARMAMATGAPLVPGAIWGSQRLLTKGRRELQRGVLVTVDFGAPVPYEADEDPQEVTDRLMVAIGELVDRAQRTYEQAPGEGSAAWWQPAHLGGSAPTPDEARDRAIAEAKARRERREAAGER